MRRFTHGSVSLAALIAAGTALAAPPQTTTLAVENMTCGTCPIVVKKALERVPRNNLQLVHLISTKRTAIPVTASIPARRTRRNSLWPRRKQAFPRRSFRNREHRHPGVGADLPQLRPRTARDHADGCVSVFLRMHPVQDAAQAEGRRLLRVLFLWIDRLSADPGTARLLSLVKRP